MQIQQSAGEDVEKGEPSALVVGVQTGAVTVESSTEIPQKWKMKLLYDLAIPPLGIYLKKPKH